MYHTWIKRSRTYFQQSDKSCKISMECENQPIAQSERVNVGVINYKEEWSFCKI